MNEAKKLTTPTVASNDQVIITNPNTGQPIPEQDKQFPCPLRRAMAVIDELDTIAKDMDEMGGMLTMIQIDNIVDALQGQIEKLRELQIAIDERMFAGIPDRGQKLQKQIDKLLEVINNG